MNPQSVLVDANILIAVLDGEDSNPNHIEARKKFNKLLDNDTKIAITPLIRYEVLRGVKSISIEEAQDILDDFVEFNITDKEANPSARIFHFSRSEAFLLANTGIKLDKQHFDVFHYTVAKIRNLELVNVNEKDFEKIEKVIALMPISPFE